MLGNDVTILFQGEVPAIQQTGFLDKGAKVVINGRRKEVLEVATDELDPTAQRVAGVAGSISESEVAKKLALSLMLAHTRTMNVAMT